MKKYMKISLLSIFSLMMYGSQNSLLKPKETRRKSDSRRALATSDGAVKKAADQRSDLSRSLPIEVPKKQQEETYSPNVYFGLGVLLEKRNSYTPGDFSGR